jgi:hypothetical protein
MRRAARSLRRRPGLATFLTARRDQLVLAVVQPEHQSVLPIGLGETMGGFDPGDPVEFREGQGFTGGRLAPPPGAPAMPGMQRGPGHLHEGAGHGIMAIIRRPARRSGATCTTSRPAAC